MFPARMSRSTRSEKNCLPLAAGRGDLIEARDRFASRTAAVAPGSRSSFPSLIQPRKVAIPQNPSHSGNRIAVSIVAAIAPRRSRRARRRALPSARSRRALPRILLRIRGKGGKA
jgi:hypothetical protein